MFGWFRKKPAPPKDLREWNEDWQIGDLAKCVEDDWVDCGSLAPSVGQIYRVSDVYEGLVWQENAISIGLSLEGFDQINAWRCTAFQKLRPEIKAADAKFTAAIKNGKPVPVDA